MRSDIALIRKRELLLREIAMLREEPDAVALADALRNLGEVERAIHGSHAGAAAYEEAVTILRTAGVPLKFAHTVRHLGDIYRHAGDPSRAERCYEESLDVYRSHPEARPLDFANALRGAALLQEQIGKPQHAAQLWKEAEGLYREANVDAGVEEAARRLARLNPPSATSP